LLAVAQRVVDQADDRVAGRADDDRVELAVDTDEAADNRSTDATGNVEADRTITVKIDRTGPDVACMAAPGILWPPEGRFVPVAVGLDVDDLLSGPGSFRLDSLTSSEGGPAGRATGESASPTPPASCRRSATRSPRSGGPTASRTRSSTGPATGRRAPRRCGCLAPCPPEAAQP
jgi:hypothetical protein